jgi:hypothetical protein
MDGGERDVGGDGEAGRVEMKDAFIEAVKPEALVT